MDRDKIRFFFQKLKNRLRHERVRFWKRFNVERLAERGYNPFENAVAFKTRLQSMLGVFDNMILSNIDE